MSAFEVGREHIPLQIGVKVLMVFGLVCAMHGTPLQRDARHQGKHIIDIVCSSKFVIMNCW